MPPRLSALDASFLQLEDHGAHMHVATVMTFDGAPPPYQDFIALVLGRLHLVPRYRQRLAFVPLGQGRPRWVDDPHFNPRYHIRHAALPAPGSERELKRLAARVFGQRLDRSKPLWELLLVEGLSGGRFALLSKTHHAVVDGVRGIDLLSVLLDASSDPSPPAGPTTGWLPRPVPSRSELLAEALLERATAPAEAARGLRGVMRTPRRAAARLTEAMAEIGAVAWAGLRPPPRTPLNVPIGPHRRYTWVDADLRRFKAIKSGLGGSVNDVVVTSVALAVGRWLRDRGEDTDKLVLRAMVPVSVRADAARGGSQTRIASMWAPLPVGLQHPRVCFEAVREAMASLTASGAAIDAKSLVELDDFAPPTMMTQAARLQAHERFANLVITNMPGPQRRLFLLGRPLRRLYPVVPLAANQAMGVAVMSYHGRLGFGLLGDFDAMPDLERLAGHLEEAIDDLATEVGPATDRARRLQREPAPAIT